MGTAEWEAYVASQSSSSGSSGGSSSGGGWSYGGDAGCIEGGLLW